MTNRELLKELHRLQLKVSELRSEAERAPKRLRASQLKIDQQQKALSEHLDAIKHIKVAIHQKEVSIKDHHATAERYQGQLKAITSKKEWDALRHEIDSQHKAIAAIEDQILELMVELDQKNAETAVLEKALQTAREEYKKAEEQIGSRQGDLLAQLKQAEVELKAAEEQMSAELKSIYNRLVAAYGGAEAICELQGASCSGCNTEATLQQQRDVAAGRIVTCKSCAKLLYA